MKNPIKYLFAGAVMRQVSPHLLWIGHRGDLRDLGRIREAGIDCLIDLAIDEPPPTIGHELAFARFPLMDGGGNERWLVRAAIDTCETILRSGRSVMVVCSSGMSRSPSIAAAALSVYTGRPPAACLLEVLGGSGDVSPSMWGQVLQALE